MGTDVDFFDREGVTRPNLVAKLAALEPKVDDVELLARLIDGHCGFDIDLNLHGFDAEKRALRKKIRVKLTSLQRLAFEMLDLRAGGRGVDSLIEVLHELSGRGGPPSAQVSAALKLLDALETITSWDLLDGGRGGAPENDVPRQHLWPRFEVVI